MGGTDRGEIGTLVLMTVALGCWIAAAITVGEAKMWRFLAVGMVLTLAGLALMRPASSAKGLEPQ
jgi:hypothetical protein